MYVNEEPGLLIRFIDLLIGTLISEKQLHSGYQAITS